MGGINRCIQNNALVDISASYNLSSPRKTIYNWFKKNNIYTHIDKPKGSDSEGRLACI